MTEYRELDVEEIAALENWIGAKGRAWKRKLADKWIEGGPSPLLYALRNSHGPAWLRTATLLGEAKRFVKAHGFVLTKNDDGEYRVDFGDGEKGANYTSDLVDACGTASAEYDRRATARLGRDIATAGAATFTAIVNTKR